MVAKKSGGMGNFEGNQGNTKVGDKRDEMELPDLMPNGPENGATATYKQALIQREVSSATERDDDLTSNYEADHN